MIKYIDLFCGIGGFRIAANYAFSKYNINSECVFSCDIDKYCQISYKQNFGHNPYGDITKIDENSIPDHDVLFAGFPCQPFSIIGTNRGFSDARGTLFFDIARIVNAKKPKVILLENVKRLFSHNKGKTLKTILSILREQGYNVFYKVLNALDFGLPQKRERIFIVAFNGEFEFKWPNSTRQKFSLNEILETKIDKKYYVSDRIRQKRHSKHKSFESPSIWHENKSGNITSYSYSCALRANGSYNYLLVNGERRLTEREMLRLQGFPDWFKLEIPYTQVRKLTGNSVPINVVEKVIESCIPYFKEPDNSSNKYKITLYDNQQNVNEKRTEVTYS